MLMACARLNVPAAFLYGGTILPGARARTDADDPGCVRGRGAQATGEMSDADLLAVERAACPGAGSCAGMYTANTMSACSEALGMALPGAASPPAVSAERTALARATGEMTVQALAAGLAASGHHDEDGVPQRGGSGDGHGRFHERDLASAGDRA